MRIRNENKNRGNPENDLSFVSLLNLFFVNGIFWKPEKEI